MSGDGSFSLLLAIGFLVLYLVIWAICLLGLRTARNRYSGKNLPSRLNTFPASSAPGVTVIRPLCGLDNNLYTTLESSMNLQYPKYEVIFALQSESDEALPVVRMLLDKHPKVNARMIIDGRRVGVNPKVNNLMLPFAEAKYDLLWVVDSTISIDSGALGRAVDAFCGARIGEGTSFDDAGEVESTRLVSDAMREAPARGDVGLVHHVPFAVVYQRTWGSLVEQAFLNTTHAKMYLAINATALDSCVIGKSNLYSKTNIAQLTTPSPSLKTLPNPPTGLEGFGPFLAEDNMIALSLWHELGLKHAMTSDVALDFLGALSLWDYVNRRIRWIRVRRRMTPIAVTLLEPFTESILAGIYGSWAIARIFCATKISLFLVHMVLWFLVDMGVKNALETNVRSLTPKIDMLSFGLAWTIREVLSLPIWVYGNTSSKVVWRGRKYRIGQSGDAIRIDE